MGFANLGPRKCLLSRKRKLTELYYATVGFEGATADSGYQQKEQAFLDANDLSKYAHSYTAYYLHSFKPEFPRDLNRAMLISFTEVVSSMNPPCRRPPMRACVQAAKLPRQKQHPSSKLSKQPTSSRPRQ